MKTEELTREVREHNGFARRMPVIEEQIKGIDRRISDLEKKEIKKNRRRLLTHGGKLIHLKILRLPF